MKIYIGKDVYIELDEVKLGYCRLVSNDLIIAPQDKGEPPAWVPTHSGMKLIWLDRELFDKLKSRKYDEPCDICPDEIRNKCKSKRLKNGM